MPTDYKENVIAYKYTPLPEESRYKKKKQKKKVKKSNHKHIYAPCYFDYGISVYRNHQKIRVYSSGTYCSICGRIGNYYFNNVPIEEANPDLPIFKREFLDFSKYISERVI